MLDFYTIMEIQSTSTEGRLKYLKFSKEDNDDDSSLENEICGGGKTYLNGHECAFRRPTRLALRTNWSEIPIGMGSKGENSNKADSSNCEGTQATKSPSDGIRPPESDCLMKTETRNFSNGDRYEGLEIREIISRRKFLKRENGCTETTTLPYHNKNVIRGGKDCHSVRTKLSNGHENRNGHKNDASISNAIAESFSSNRKFRTENYSPDQSAQQGNSSLTDVPAVDATSKLEALETECLSDHNCTLDNCFPDRGLRINNCVVDVESIEQNRLEGSRITIEADIAVPNNLPTDVTILKSLPETINRNSTTEDDVCRPADRESLSNTSINDASKITENVVENKSLEKETKVVADESLEKGGNSKDSSCLCKWINCDEKLKTAFDLKTHVKESHVKTMAASDLFFCFWEGCKVYNKPSSSYNWLVKHVNTHVGIRPFQCVIEPCDQSFASQNALVRHVQSHFNERSKYYKKTKSNSQKVNVTPTKSKPSTPEESGSASESSSKLVSRKKKFKLFTRRRMQVTRGRDDDEIDCVTMDYIKHKLAITENVSNGCGFNGVRFQCNRKILGRRTGSSGEGEYLTNLTNCRRHAEWIPEKHLSRTNSLELPISMIPDEQQEIIYARIFGHNTKRRKRKGR